MGNGTSTASFEAERLEAFRRRGFDSDGRRVDLGHGHRSYVLERKGAEGDALVLVHGGLAEASVWACVAGSLPGRVVLADRPGFGLSDPIDYRGVDFRRSASEWLRGLLDALGIERAHLVGNSMGGFFSIAFATAQPERVRSLVLVGAPAGLDRPLPVFLRLWATPLLGRLVGAVVARTRDPEVVRTRVMEDLLAHPERIEDDLLGLAIAATALPGAGLASRTMLRVVADRGGWRRDLSIREDLAALDVPTLFLWGDGDAFAPPSSGAEVAARMPRGRLEVVPDAGHLPQTDQPEILSAAISSFVAALPA